MTIKFNFAVCAIEEFKHMDELSLDEPKTLLLMHEEKFKQPHTEEQALKDSTKNRPTPKRDRGGSERKGNNDCSN